MKIKSLLVIIALCLSMSAFAGGKYAGVPKKYHELLNKTMTVAGDNAKELKKALKDAPPIKKRAWPS